MNETERKVKNIYIFSDKIQRYQGPLLRYIDILAKSWVSGET